MINSLLKSLIYPKRKIDNKAILFKFIHFSGVSRDNLKPTANNFNDENLSCDWNRYFTAQQTRDLVGKQFKKGTTEFKNTLEYFVCKLEVEKILNTNPVQKFEHDPIFTFPQKKGFPNNRAHSLVIGKKEKDKQSLKSRGQIAMNAKWVIFDAVEFRQLCDKI